MKNHDLPHASGLDFGVPPSQLMKVPIADRKPREATQLKVDSFDWVRNVHRISKQGNERSWLEHGTYALSRARRLSSRASSGECEQQQLPSRKRRRNYLRRAG